MPFRTRPIFLPLDYGRVRCVLEDLLAQKGMTQRELSRKTGLRLDSIQKFCSNAHTRYPIDQLVLICSCLDCDITDLLVYDPPAGSLSQRIHKIAQDYARIEQDQKLSRQFAAEEQNFLQFLEEFRSSEDFPENM